MKSFKCQSPKTKPMRTQQRSFACTASFLLMTLTVWGCGNPPNQPSTKSSEDPSAGPKVNKAAGRKVPRDESLASDEYIRLGLPAYDRVWFGNDMARVQKVLASLAQEDYRHFPRYKSKRSGDVFARLTSPQNLELFRDRSLPLEARFPQVLNHVQATNQIFKLYVSGFVKNEIADSELVELMAAQYRSSVVMLELVDEFLPTIKKDDPTYQVRMHGLEKVKLGLAGVVSGGLQTLTERENYRKSELVRLVGYMQESFPLLVPRLPPGARTETMQELERMQEDPAMKYLQPGLEELRSKVKRSLDKAEAP
jgi:hypothetical protein